MKQFLLFCAFSLCAVVSNGQTYGFGTAGNCVLPPGFTLSQGAKVGGYNNPNLNCADDCGIVTPGVGGNNPANIIFPPATFDGNKATICFDIFAFEANLKCDNSVPFPCDGAGVTVIAYIVAGNYDKSTAPSAGEYFGKSEPRIIIKNGNVCINVFFTGTLTPGANYRIFLDFTAPDNCNQPGIKYVIDNIKIIYSEESTLPVSFKGFNATRKNDAIQLSWETASENNNQGFNVQRLDDNKWKTISFIPTKAPDGNSSSLLMYNFTDNATYAGLTQYRIQQVDINGRISTSDIRTVRNNVQQTKTIIHPNPSANGNVMVTFAENNSIQDVFVSDVTGKIIQQWRGVAQNNLQITGLKKGMYIIRIIDQKTGNSANEKLVVN